MPRPKEQPLPQALIEMFDQLRRLGIDPLVLPSDRLDGLPIALKKVLVDTGMVERAAPAVSVICPGCAESCAMPVFQRPRHDGSIVAFVSCDKRDDIGRVLLTPAMLDLWQVSTSSLARGLAKLLDQRHQIPLGQGFRLGWVSGGAGMVDVQLFCDDKGPHIVVAGHRLDLTQVLTWNGVGLGLNVAALTHSADVPKSQNHEPTEQRSARLLARKRQLKGQRVRDFIKRIAAEERCDASYVKRLIAMAEKTELAQAAKRKEPAKPFDALVRMGVGDGGVSPERKSNSRQ
jgi:hypothetical protein